MFNAGSVRFTPLADGAYTEVTVELLYVPPAGAVGAAVARLFGKDVGQDMFADLTTFKHIMEAGEPLLRTTPLSVSGGCGAAGALKPGRRGPACGDPTA